MSLQSPIETERVRKVILYFYLEDDSIHIAEARTENSGLPQVCFRTALNIYFKRFFVWSSDRTRPMMLFVCMYILAYILDLSIP